MSEGEPAPPALRLLHQMARSGGTLISRSLACMAGVLLLSEVHCRATGFVNPMAQAQAWFELFSPAEWAALQARGTLTFAAAIGEIEKATSRRPACLVLREWSHLDFTGVPFVADPAHRSLTAADLEGSFDLIRVATTRHPLDQYLSASAVPSLRGRLDLDAYMRGYRRFAEMAVATGFVTYESFCVDPMATMRRLCGSLRLPFDETFIERQAQWTRITGDHAIGGSRAAGAPRPLEQRSCPGSLLDRLHDHADYRASLDLLGYTHPAMRAEAQGPDDASSPSTGSFLAA